MKIRRGGEVLWMCSRSVVLVIEKMMKDENLCCCSYGRSGHILSKCFGKHEIAVDLLMLSWSVWMV